MKEELIILDAEKVIKCTDDTRFIVLPHKDMVKSNEVKCSIVFSTPGVSAEIIALYNLQAGEKTVFTTEAIHTVPNTSCITKVKGVLHDNTVSSYIGKIIIKKEAQQTSSFLEDAVLVIGDNTKNRADPILEIEADDVRASHGATTGRIDAGQLYYLTSRGLALTESQKLIIDGFFAKLVDEISDTSIRAAVLDYLRL